MSQSSVFKAVITGLVITAGSTQSLASEASDQVSSPREFHPQALAEPYVTVSRHTAPIIQPMVYS